MSKTKVNKRKVNKDLTEEEKQLTNNILSQLTQLLQGAGEEEKDESIELTDEEEEEAEKQEDEEEEEKSEEKAEDEDEDEEKTEKEDGPTASDDAETRIEDGDPPVTEESLDDVKKGIKKLLKQINKPVAKSKVSKNDNITNALATVAQVCKMLVSKVEQQEQTTDNILKGLNVADQFEETYKPKKAKVKEPQVTPANAGLIVKSLLEQMGAIKKEKEISNNRTQFGNYDSEGIRKDLTDVMRFTSQERARENLKNSKGRF